MNFIDLELNERIQKALKDISFNEVTNIQKEVIPKILNNENILASSKTGSGKTASFMIPIINKILCNERFNINTLVISPTRDLAIQIHEETAKFAKYTNVRSLCVIGGVKESYQIDKIKKGVDIIIATPGRLIDLIKQNIINFNNVNSFVIDEVDKLFELGFKKVLDFIIKLISNKTQKLLFSATINQNVIDIANNLMDRFELVEIEEDNTNNITNEIYFIEQEKKIYLLKDIIKYNKIKSVIVFCRTKQLAQSVSNFLRGNNIPSNYINKDKNQVQRNIAINELKNNKITALVATDIVSRGIDINNLSHVINFDFPNDNTTYIHRCGRTGRNQKNGVVISFCSENELSSYNMVDVDFIKKEHKYKRG